MNNTDIDLHLKSFAESFVMDDRREKWVGLLTERPENIYSLSYKLFNYLDHNYIEQNDSLSGVASDDVPGVFYDFDNEPKCISFKEAREQVAGRDAMFSIEPGRLAVYFYHEGWNFVCKK